MQLSKIFKKHSDKNGRTSLDEKDARQAYLMLLPVLIGFFIFTIYPMGWLIKWSFFDYNGMTDATFVGLDNFVRVIFRDKQFWSAVLNTLYIVSMKLIIEIPLALFLAVALNSTKKINSFYRTLFFMPAIVSTAIVGLVFHLMFEPFSGSINLVLKALNIIEKNVNWFGTKSLANWVIIIASIWRSFGIYMIFFLMGLQSIPKDYYECAELDGANIWAKFKHITLPMLSPVMKVVLMLAIVNSMKMSDLVLVLTNGQPAGSTEVIMSYTFKYFFSYGNADFISQYGYASALSVVTALILSVITIVYFRATKNMGKIY